MAVESWKSLPITQKRLVMLAFFFIIAFAITVSGTLTSLSPSETQDLKDQFNQLQQQVENMSLAERTQTIFLNNFEICLIMFVPFVGPFFGALVLHNTGVLIGAISTASNASPLTILFSLFLFPHSWLEYISYSLALSQSFWLIWAFFQHRGRAEVFKTLFFIALAAVMLIVGAVLESLIIP